MEDKTLNFVLVLVTGRVWGKTSTTLKNKAIDIWDCEPWMDFILLHFMPCIIPYGRIKLLRRIRWALKSNAVNAATNHFLRSIGDAQNAAKDLN